MCRIKLVPFCAFAIAGFAATPALAKPATSPSDCTVETGVPSGNGLTFLASFCTANQSNSTIATDVLQILAAEGYTGVTYLGRQDGTGLVNGDHISTSSSDGGLTGTWTFTPGTTGDIGAFIAIHAGNGQSAEELFKIDNPSSSDTGTWSTFDGHGLSNLDLFGINLPPPPVIDPPPAIDPPAKVPEPLTISLFGTGLAGALASRRRKKAKAA